MLYHIQPEKILFLDIETVPMVPDYLSLPEPFRSHWDKKSERINRSEEGTPASLFHRAGIYAEFGKVICISAGYLRGKEFRIKSFYGDDENHLLNGFADMLRQHYPPQEHLLCAHNGKEFDFPYLSRRMLVQGIPIPDILNTAGRKPWEVSHLDTMELWKFGDYKNYTSLDLLAALLGIPTPKEDMDGSMVADAYYKDHDLERIVRYCQMDTLTVARIFLRYLGRKGIDDQMVCIVQE
ncbi:MAG: 3'-5' exonuclease [Bacteroidales bacterium]|nr:3'-5' exonuclease [Bacteroidales bacterium]